MPGLERAKLIPVSGNNDTPDLQNAIDVQFNPVSMKVNLANTLKANQNNSNSRATQYVDKSSSTLTIELVFDTTYVPTPSDGAESGAAESTTASSGGSANQIEQGADVRQYTKKIAEKFIKPVESGSQMQAPSRVLFQWGSFEFIGMVESYDETLDFFSPTGRPLRATVALKLKEDRYQFRSNDSAKQDMAQNPSLAMTGSGSGNEAGQNQSPVPGASSGAGSWRDNALFNGIETPRLPSMAALALPSVSLEASIGIGASAGIGIDIGGGIGVNLSAGVSLSGGISVSTGGGSSKGGSAAGNSAMSGGVPTTKSTSVPPAFKYGNSSALGTSVPGAFPTGKQSGVSAAGLQTGALQLRSAKAVVSSSGQLIPTDSSSGAGAVSTGSSKGRSAANSTDPSVRTAGTSIRTSGVSVVGLLKNTADGSVGFD